MTTQEMRELDEWIAVNLFGWQQFREEEYPHRMFWREGEEGSRVWDGPTSPTTDAAAAMEVLQKCLSVTMDSVYGFDISIQNRGSRFNVSSWPKLGIEVEADTLSTAICLFARELFKEDGE